MNEATVTEDGKVAIPEIIRKELGLVPGTILAFDAEGPVLRLRKVIDEKRMRSVLGFASEAMEGKTAEEWLEWMRGPVELPPEDAGR